tara:strand:+ start:822 stop:2069 length:1248 start_codon:yes stop_codon:yes gene_type:complete
MGAREHAVAWKLTQSPDVEEVFVAPGNAGTAQIATNVPIDPKDIDSLIEAANDLKIDFYLATMDDPQPLGLVDRLRERGLPCYGPTAAAAQIEASKAWSKQFMVDHGITTAIHRTFRDHNDAVAYVESLPDAPIVVKASGLAAGKGALVCDDREGALLALDTIMIKRAFGTAGDQVVIEERLQGWETSTHAICDGETAVLTPSATDYKRALTGDRGLNTGGMGAYSPSIDVTTALSKAIEQEVVKPTIEGMAALGSPFNGTLYPGLMITDRGNYVLEYNARLGDPEAQVLMARLNSDLFTICRAAAEGGLSSVDISWSKEPAVGVVIASGGYPREYTTGHLIDGLDKIDEDVQVFHAGTALTPKGVVTNGGRVLTVVARGPTLAAARAKAYENAQFIRFEGAYMRSDIAEIEEIR